ncbi:MAG: hypothetical protein M3Q69_11260, partial [Acidobacteriota bacterium]|nr:hypothetical protein [Acidobacteriota bacterium]
RELIAQQGTYIAPSRSLARLALRAGDGAAALEGINGYYHVTAFSGPPHVIAAAHAELARLLPAWTGTPAERPAIARALGGIRFYEEASIVDPHGALAKYAAALRNIETLTNEYYRNIAIGNEKPAVLRDGVDRELRAVDPSRDALTKRFGVSINIGKTSDHTDLHMGHAVVDRAMEVEQYGHKGTVRFVALDTMVSNGFSSWASDGRSGDGGWGTAKQIVQVRSMYADDALGQWALVNDPEVRAEDEKETAEETQRDVVRAKENPIQIFTGMSQRIRRQYLDRIAAETKTRDAFLARVESEHFQSSIVLHEGRHAIDAALGERFKAWELEYRAKLSQIALAPSTRGALDGVIDYDIGGDSPHGKANTKLVSEIVAWMKNHQREIAGLDANAPLLPQLDKLTDEQIRAAVRALDPLAQAIR